MRYLGRISGSGTLQHDGDFITRTTFDIDGFLVKKIRLNCGKIKAPASVLKNIFDEDVELITDDGCVLALTLSDSQLSHATDVAHVDVKAVLPPGRGRSAAFDANGDSPGVLS